jgi:hypothetical protein
MDKERNLADFLWPVGGSVFGLIVVPVAIAQYPRFFNENEWLLPASVGIVVLCWCIPLVLHSRARAIYSTISARGALGKVLLISILLLAVFALYWGSLWLLGIHRNHLKALNAPNPQDEGKVNQPAPVRVEPPQSSRPKPPRPAAAASLEFTHTAIVKFMPADSPFIDDHPAEVHVIYANTKGGIAREVVPNCAALIFSGSIGNAHLRDVENANWNLFNTAWLANVASGLVTENDIAGHDVTHFCLARTSDIKPAEVQRLKEELDVVYVFWAVKWKDETGQYESEICTFFLPEGTTLIPKAPAQWRACITGHNVTRRPFKPPAD